VSKDGSRYNPQGSEFGVLVAEVTTDDLLLWEEQVRGRARRQPAARGGRLTPGVVLAQPGLCLPDALGMGNRVLEKWTLSGAKVRAAALRRGAGRGGG